MTGKKALPLPEITVNRFAAAFVKRERKVRATQGIIFPNGKLFVRAELR